MVELDAGHWQAGMHETVLCMALWACSELLYAGLQAESIVRSNAAKGLDWGNSRQYALPGSQARGDTTREPLPLRSNDSDELRDGSTQHSEMEQVSSVLHWLSHSLVGSSPMHLLLKNQGIVLLVISSRTFTLSHLLLYQKQELSET
mmetsp:Transcript_37966/g.59226  ORF Transcript_37966/g.59226 Transcript_37966/m.59226 type:complete len:147 (-) Transcript_37966:324-764(-)